MPRRRNSVRAVRGAALLVAALSIVALRAADPFDAVTDLLKQEIAERKIAGAVAAVSRHGTVAYQQAAGVQDLETRVPMTERTLFRIYSMSKPVTAVAVMM